MSGVGRPKHRHAARYGNMEKLPKIALQRLRQGATGASPEAPLSGRPGGIGHPDADLLAAFVEKKLTDRERASVMSHLANCATCRETVALALPPLAEETTPVKVSGRRPAWFSIPIVRWGAVTAALGTIVITVILNRRVIQPVHETTVVVRTQPPAPAPAPPAEGMPEASIPAATETRRDVLRPKGTARPEARTKATNLNQPAEKQAGAAARIAERSVTVSAEAAPAKAEPSPSYGVGGRVPIAAPATTAAPAPAQSTMAARATNAGVAHEQTGMVEAAKDKSVASAESRKEPALAGVQQGEGAPRAQALLKSADTLAEPAAKKRVKALALSVRWSISNAGKVERSVDGGTTCEELHVNDSLVFRVVTAAESEVWAGGARGALYHSVDGGEHWTRVYLNPAQSGPDDAIVGINFSGPLHGRVTTAADERWITSDGGRHWTRE